MSETNQFSRGSRPRIFTPNIRPEAMVNGGPSAQSDEALEAKGIVVDESVFSQNSNEADVSRSSYIDDGAEPSAETMQMDQ